MKDKKVLVNIVLQVFMTTTVVTKFGKKVDKKRHEHLFDTVPFLTRCIFLTEISKSTVKKGIGGVRIPCYMSIE